MSRKFFTIPAETYARAVLVMKTIVTIKVLVVSPLLYPSLYIQKERKKANSRNRIPNREFGTKETRAMLILLKSNFRIPSYIISN